MAMNDFILRPLPSGEPPVGAATARRMTADGPRPCRRCLRNAKVGEELLLLPYDPFVMAAAGSRPRRSC